MNLHAAIEAVRAESAADASGSAATRRRVLASIERSPRRRLHVVVASVIASMFGATAFAYYAHTPRVTPAQVTPPAPVASAPAVEPIVTPRRASTRVELPAVALSVEERTVAPTALPKPAPVTEVPSPPPARDPELAMYAEAHAIHFRDRDMAAALDAWNRYLAAAPDGKLAPEARFNRVVALVKLERWSDASDALDALADSSFRAAELARLREVVSSHLGRTR